MCWELVLIPEPLLLLRGEMYAALGVYHQALAAYWNAISQGAAPDSMTQVISDVAITGARLDTALSALLQHLRTMEPIAGTDQEIQRAVRLQALLHEELSLMR